MALDSDSESELSFKLDSDTESDSEPNAGKSESESSLNPILNLSLMPIQIHICKRAVTSSVRYI